MKYDIFCNYWPLLSLSYEEFCTLSIGSSHRRMLFLNRKYILMANGVFDPISLEKGRELNDRSFL